MKNESTKQVLLVENKPQIQKLLIKNIIQAGIDVTSANSTQEAMELMEQLDNFFDLVIVNANLPNKKAFELCTNIRKKYTVNQLPIYFIILDVGCIDINDIFACGGNDYILFPLSCDEFNAKIQFFINHKKDYDKKQMLMNLIDIRTQVFKMNTHDLKNPLSSIFSLSGIPVESFKDKEEISQTLKVIHDASKIMMVLVNQNLEYLNVTSGSIKLSNELVDIVSIVNQIVEINQPLAKNKNQTILFNFPDEYCLVYSDNGKLYQAINNIVGNAIKFSPQYKTIWIDVTRNPKKDKIQIIVKDEGPGFKKEEVDKVFVKFGKHSATPTGDEISTGLGLLIAKQIINLSNGEIKLESEEGKGAKFIIEFKAEYLESYS